MSLIQDCRPSLTSALVSRSAGHAARYLLLTGDGQPTWTDDPGAATSFASMREAARVAFRLPASLRAYGLPLTLEMARSRAHQGARPRLPAWDSGR